MNEYERERLANMARNEALLKEIGLAGVKVPKARPTTTPKKSTTTPKKRAASELVSRRTSSRLSGIPADSEIAKKKYEVENEARLEQEKQKRKRVEGPLELKEVIADGSRWDEASGLLSEVSKVSTERKATRAKSSTDDDLAQLRAQFGSMRLLAKWEPNRIKITPERIFSIGMHPGMKKLGIAGDKLGNLGIWDIEGTKASEIKVENGEVDEVPEEEPLVHHFKLHSRTISAFSFDPQNASKLYSSSYDGSVRCLDLPSGVATEVFGSDTDQAITGVEAHPDGNSVYFSTLDGEIGFRDLRTKESDCISYQLHDRKIGSFGIHPLQPHIISTASLDRTLKIWDFRNLVGPRKDRRPTLKAEYLCKLSVSSAYINSNGMVLATAFDNTLKLFDISGISTWPGGIANQVVPDFEVPHNNQTGRWITVFKAAWQQTPADGIQKFVVGDMRRKINVFNGEGDLIGDLEDELITAIPAVVAFHPSQNWVLAGNGSGKALFFE